MPLKRQVVGVLADGDRGRETDRVAARLLKLRRAFGRLDAATVASVLLPLVLDHDEATLDDIDFVGFFELAVEHSELAAALGAHLIGVVERVHLLDTQGARPGREDRAPFAFFFSARRCCRLRFSLLSPNSA